jgi:adenosine kinase
LVYSRDRGKTKEEMVSAIKVQNVVDTTGCGDSFAGGLGFALMHKPKDYVGAARFGNALGALRTQGKTFGVFKPLAEIKKIIELGYIRPN